MPKTYKVRAKNRPDEELEVGEAEYNSLRKQGYLVEEDEKPEVESKKAPEPTTVPRKPVN